MDGVERTRLITAEGFFAMPDVPGKWLELVSGEVVEARPAGAQQGWITARLAMRLHDLANQRDLGLAFCDGVGYVLHRDPDTVRIPDASFVAWVQVPDRIVPRGFWAIPPTVAIEFIIPDDLAHDVHDRKCDYLDAGSREVWLLWGPAQRISRWYTDRTCQELKPDDVLDGGDLLPGFRVKVADLFDVE